MLSGLQLKLLGGGLILALLAAAYFWISGVLNERADLREWQAEILEATQEASDNPKLTEKGVKPQITAMGESLDGLREKLAVQNKAVDDLTEKRNKALAEAARQAALRKEVIAQSQSLAKQLRNEALTPVERDFLEAELRRVQDLAWERGL